MVVVEIALPQPAYQPKPVELVNVVYCLPSVPPLSADHKIAAGLDSLEPFCGKRLLDESDDSFLHELIKVVAVGGPGPSIGLVVREVAR